MDIGERVARLEAMVDGIRGELATIRCDIEGPPWEGSIRQGLRLLGDVSEADRLAVSAFVASQEYAKEAQRDRIRAEQARWSRGWRWFGAGVALATVAAAWLGPFLH